MEEETQNIVKLIEKSNVKIPRGEIFVIKERCKGCKFCIEFCPKKVLIQSKEINSKGFHPPMLQEEPPLKVCVNCGFCTIICPEFAIYSQEVKYE